MPNKGLKIGAGISAGVDSFLKSYMSVKQMKEQEKLQQNAFIVQVLTKQLEDDNVPLYQRAKILDSIPSLVGIKKMDRRLSEMMGLDQAMLDEEVTKEEGTPARDSVDPNITDPSMASSVRLQGTAPTLQRKGDLTPALIKRKLDSETRRAIDEGDIDKQKRIAQINFELQEKSYKANGYRITSEGTNSQGEYVQILTNNSGDTKVNKLPEGFKPLKLQIAERNINKPSVFVRDREDYWESQGYSPEEANRKALEDANEQFKLKLKTGEAFVTGQQQRISGTQPIQPAQNVDDKRAFAERKSILRANVNTTKRQATEASQDAFNKAKQANDHWTNVVEPIKREMQKLLDDGRETTDVEYSRQQGRLNLEIERYNDLKKAADDASAKDKSLRDSLTESEEILKEYEGTVGGTSSTFDSKIKEAVNIVRRNNPEATANMTDDQIVEYLRTKKKIK